MTSLQSKLAAIVWPADIERVGATTTVARVGAIRGFMAGYLAGWSAARREGR